MDAATIATLRKRIEELEAERQQAVAVANARTGAIGELMRLIEAASATDSAAALSLVLPSKVPRTEAIQNGS